MAAKRQFFRVNINFQTVKIESGSERIRFVSRLTIA